MSLQERLRDGIECAPWVKEEVVKLEAELSAMTQRAEAAEARIKASREQERVDFRVAIATQLQQHDEVMEHDPTKCYVPDFDGLEQRARTNYLNEPMFRRRVDSIYYAAPVIPPDVQRKLDELEQAAQDEIDRLEAQKLVLSNKLAEAKSNSDRYKFLRRISDEPELIELLNAADENPKSPDDFDAAIDKAMLAAAPQPGGSNE